MRKIIDEIKSMDTFNQKMFRNIFVIGMVCIGSLINVCCKLIKIS